MAELSGTPSENGRAIREPSQGHQRIDLDQPVVLPSTAMIHCLARP